MTTRRRVPVTACAALCLMLLAGPSAAAADIDLGIEISEIMYDPAVSDAGGEWVEIQNRTGAVLDITGWHLDDGDDQVILQRPGYASIAAIPPGGFAVISEPASTVDFSVLYPDPSLIVGVTDSALNLLQSGEQILLANADQSIVFQQFVYPDLAVDAALVKTVICGDEDDPAVWAAGTTEGLPGELNPGQDPCEGTPTASPTPAPSATATPTGAPSATPTPTSPSSATPTRTPSPTATPTGPAPTATSTAEPTARAIVVNEVHYDPEGTDTGLEFIELLNAGSGPVNLTGHDLRCADAGTYAIPQVDGSDLMLDPGARLLVHVNLAGTDTTEELHFESGANMTNTDDAIVLWSSTTHSAATLVDYVAYGSPDQPFHGQAEDAGLWPPGDFVPDAGEGFSIDRDPDGNPGVGSDWWAACLPSALAANCTGAPSATPTPTASGVPSATPTAPPTAAPGVVINEVLYDPEGTDTGLEFIELLNTAAEAIDMDGWSLDPDDARYFDFPAGFTLPPSTYCVIHVNADPPATPAPTPGAIHLWGGSGTSNMGNTSGAVTLYAAGGHTATTVRDFVQWGATGQPGESVALEAGIWPEGGYTIDVDEGHGLNLCPNGIDLNDPAQWTASLPSEGGENPCPTPPPTATGTATPTVTPTATPTATPPPPVEPVILAAGYWDSYFSQAAGGMISILAVLYDPDGLGDVESVMVEYGGLPVLELLDDGLSGDFAAGDGVYGFQVEAAGAGSSGPESLLPLRVVARDRTGFESRTWPFLTVLPSYGAGPGGSGAEPPAPWSRAAAGAASPDGPFILAAGYEDSRISTEEGGTLTILALVGTPRGGCDDVERVELAYAGQIVGLSLQRVEDCFFRAVVEVPAGVPAGEYLLELVATDAWGARSDFWPYLTVHF